MQCFCDKNWWHMDETCATPGAHWMQYPYACPTDYLYWPGRFTDDPDEFGPPIGFRVPSFLEHPDLPRAVKARGRPCFCLQLCDQHEASAFMPQGGACRVLF